MFLPVCSGRWPTAVAPRPKGTRAWFAYPGLALRPGRGAELGLPVRPRPRSPELSAETLKMLSAWGAGVAGACPQRWQERAGDPLPDPESGRTSEPLRRATPKQSVS